MSIPEQPDTVIPLPVVVVDPLCGRLDVVVGAMDAGKSTMLLRRLDRYSTLLKCRVLYVNHVLDEKRPPKKGDWRTRNGDRIRIVARVVSSENGGGAQRPAHAVVPCEGGLIDVAYADNLYNIKDLALMYDVIGIDEAQFFPDLLAFCDEMHKNKRKHLLVAGVDSTANMEEFGRVCQLVWRSDTFVKVQGVCGKCKGGESTRSGYPEGACVLEGFAHKLASFTQKKGEYAEDTSVVDVGDCETKYESVCRKHHRLTVPVP